MPEIFLSLQILVGSDCGFIRHAKCVDFVIAVMIADKGHFPVHYRDRNCVPWGGVDSVRSSYVIEFEMLLF